MMCYHHLTTFERGRIQELLSLGYSHRRIAAKIHHYRSCVDREILRNAQASACVGESKGIEGSFSVNGTMDGESGFLNLQAGDWIEQPQLEDAEVASA